MAIVDFENKDVIKGIKIWIKALRSGNYKQARERFHHIEKLYNGNEKHSHCCLGVGCDVFVPKEKRIFSYKSDVMKGIEPQSQPHSPDWLKNVNYNFKAKFGYTLMSLNDSEGFTFDMIADCLELIYIHKAVTEKDVEEMNAAGIN